jgi:NAD(P)-dependent dehydrogenase (short-subunit alcohol dehydrogenase family)
MKSEKIAIVTGAGRGIGRATAIELSRRGFRPVLVSRNSEQLCQTAEACSGDAIVLAEDISNPQGVARVVEQTISLAGRVDAFIHCAGVAVQRDVDEITVEEWRQTIDTNLSPIIYFCRLLWPIWRKQGGGVLVNVSSYAARDPFDGLEAYGAAKAGVNLLGLALNRKGKQIGVRVHTVAPAATETAMFRSLLTKEQYPTEKTLDPADVAKVIVQCVCGDLIHTSGEVIYVHKNA